MITIEIEDAIRAKNLKRVESLIKQLIKTSGEDKEARYQAAIYYRRVAEYKKALAVLNVDLTPRRWERLNEKDLDLQIMALQILAFMGACTLALDLIERIPDERKKMRFFDVGLTYMHCNEFEKTIECLDYGLSHLTRKKSLLAANAASAIAVCYGLLGNRREAEKYSKIATSNSDDQLLQNLAKLADLMAKIHSQDAKPADSLSKEVLDFFQNTELRGPHAMALQYRGAALILNKKYEEAREFLDHAFSRSYIPGAHPSMWMGVLYFQGLLQFKLTGNIPPQWERIIVYPSRLNCKCPEMLKEKVEIPKSLLMSLDGRSERIGNKIHYDLASKTKIVNAGSDSAQYSVGFEVLDEALIILLLAGNLGISEYAFFDAIWGADSAVGQCQRRIAQILIRLRRQGFEIELKSGQLRLISGAEITCSWSTEKKPHGWPFLENRPRFSRQDVQRFFSVSKTQALVICNEWVEGGYVSVKNTGPRAFYIQ